ncbi:hypothetical protein J6590_041661, partial [Homalodisca vitripennis]
FAPKLYRERRREVSVVPSLPVVLNGNGFSVTRAGKRFQRFAWKTLQINVGGSVANDWRGISQKLTNYCNIAHKEQVLVPQSSRTVKRTTLLSVVNSFGKARGLN